MTVNVRTMRSSSVRPQFARAATPPEQLRDSASKDGSTPGGLMRHTTRGEMKSYQRKLAIRRITSAETPMVVESKRRNLEPRSTDHHLQRIRTGIPYFTFMQFIPPMLTEVGYQLDLITHEETKSMAGLVNPSPLNCVPNEWIHLSFEFLL
jgi:hypothetical protein